MQNLVLEGIEAHGVVADALLLAEGLGGGLSRGETAALGASEIGAQIKRGAETTLLLDLANISAQNLGVYGVHLRDGLADSVDLADLVCGTTSHLSNAQLSQLGLEGVQLLDQLCLGLSSEGLR